MNGRKSYLPRMEGALTDPTPPMCFLGLGNFTDVTPLELFFWHESFHYFPTVISLLTPG